MSTTPESTLKLDVYSLVNNRIIDLLEQGTVPWEQPWTGSGIPTNLVSKRQYRGINLWLLLSLNYELNLFLTWQQIKQLGGSVKQGEHGHIVIFWRSLLKDANEDDSAQDKPKRPAMLRYYKVFNVAQCYDLPQRIFPAVITTHQTSLEPCELIVKEMPNCPKIKFQKQEAFYVLKEDYINMPKPKTFTSMEKYYSTLYHEMIHSTGHESRLNRKTINEMAEFGSDTYSLEELVAEIGSSYLCSFAGISSDVIGHNAAYIQAWLSKLKNDKRFIITASSYAQRAADYILNITAESSGAKSEDEN